jgi:ADP-ribose pyrophosphatase YjhB (NUDIX family)
VGSLVQGDIVGAGDRWIPDEEYRMIRDRVPIVCVDLLPMTNESTPRVGLISRQTYNHRQGWCLIGGAVLIDESLDNAVARHLKATLGISMSIVPGTLRMIVVAEYFRQPWPESLYDPRKHAVALTHVGVCSGNPEPVGEASDFQWFSIDSLPLPAEFGFGQDRVVHRLIEAILLRLDQ